MKQLIECVPNISEGRDLIKINTIAEEVEKFPGVKLLNIDPGKATNRTVITFVGEPQYVVQAAFMLIKKAQELIDMRLHSGEHPRMGATDVCPLIPISGVTVDECIEYSKKLAKKVGEIDTSINALKKIVFIENNNIAYLSQLYKLLLKKINFI